MAELTRDELRIINGTYSDPDERRRVCEAVKSGEMLAYIIGKWFFYRHDFVINRDCLVPRPDTERVAEEAVALLPENGSFADLCTGSGCIGLTLLDERKDCRRGLLVDLSAGALDAAAQSAELLGCMERAVLVTADILSDDPLGDEKFDLIISNPPYIRSADIDEYPGLAAEPRLALDGGVDGLVFYRRIVGAFAKNLTDGGAFVFEIGFDQADDISSIAAENGFDTKIGKDYSGNDRVAVLTRRNFSGL